MIWLDILWASPAVCTTMWWNAFGVMLLCMSSPVDYWHLASSDMKFYFSVTTRLCFPFHFVVFVTSCNRTLWKLQVGGYFLCMISYGQHMHHLYHYLATTSIVFCWCLLYSRDILLAIFPTCALHPPDSFHPVRPLATFVLLLISNVAGTPIPCCMWKLNKRVSAYWRYTSALIKRSVQLDSRITLHGFWTTQKEFHCCKRECDIWQGRPRCVFWWRFRLVDERSHCAVCSVYKFSFLYALQREVCSAAFAHCCFTRFANLQSLLIYNICFNFLKLKLKWWFGWLEGHAHETSA